MPELPQNLRDEFARLAALPGDGDAISPSVADDDAPTTSAPEETATVTAAPAQPAPTPTQAKPSRVNLDDLDDFRKFRAERDKREAELKKQLADRDAALEAQRRQDEQLQMQQLNQRLGATYDDAERARLLDEAAALRGRAYYEQWQKWEQHKTERLRAEGLDPQDQRFQKQYSGEPGALEFERDLLAAARERFEQERAQFKPENVQALVRAELAKLQQAQGLNYTDTGDAAPQGTPDIEQAMDDFNQGRIGYAEFKRRTSKT